MHKYTLLRCMMQHNVASKKRQIERWSKIQYIFPIHLTCVVCEHTDLNDNFQKLYSHDLFNAGTLIRHNCPKCGLIFGDLRFLSLSEKEIQDDHDDVYSYFEEGDTVPFIMNALNSLTLFENKSLSYLDYACGIGGMIPILKRLGYNIHGYDKYVTNDHVLNNIDDMKFDVIYVNNFIEHVIHPIDDLKKILVHLNDNGHLIIMSDCLDEYKIEYTHYHVYFYTGNSFNVMCNKLHLDIIESKTIGPCKIKVLKKTPTINTNVSSAQRYYDKKFKYIYTFIIFIILSLLYKILHDDGFIQRPDSAQGVLRTAFGHAARIRRL